MTDGAAQVRIAGDTVTFRIAYVDQGTSAAVDLTSRAIVPSGRFVQENSSVRYELTLQNGGVTMFDAARGLVDFHLTAAQSGGTIPYRDYFGAPGPCRLLAFGQDAAGHRETYVVAPVEMLNANSADIASIPLPAPIVAAVGPSGPAGPPGPGSDSFIDSIIFGG